MDTNRLTVNEMVDMAITIIQNRINNAEERREHYSDSIRCMSKNLDSIGRNAEQISDYANRLTIFETEITDHEYFMGMLKSIKKELDKEEE